MRVATYSVRSNFGSSIRKALVSAMALVAMAGGLPAEEAPSFESDVLPLFKEKCVVCHSNPVKAGGLLLGSHKELMTGGSKGPAVVPGKADSSLLVKMLDGRVKPQMPQGSAPLDPREMAVIRNWINAGARPGGEPASASANALPDIRPAIAVESQVGAVAFRNDGGLVAAGRYKQVQLLDGSTRRVVATLEGHDDAVRAVAFSPDGKLLAAAGGLPARKGQVKIWDVATRREIRTIEGHTDNIFAVAFSRDGATLATASYDKLIKLWDVATGQETRTLKDHTDAVFALAFSPDGKWLASGSADRTVKVWDWTKGERLFTLSDSLDAIHCLAWHPSGTHIAASGADRTVRTWEVTSAPSPGGKLSQSITGHEDSVLQIIYSPDGRKLITASADRAIKVWDPETLVEQKVLPLQPDWVLALVFSPDGKWLAAGRYDGSLDWYAASELEVAAGRPARAALVQE